MLGAGGQIARHVINQLADKQTIIQKYSGDENVCLDARLLRNILFNLISNAIKFSPEDGRIELSTQVDAAAISILVNDHGIGISEQDQQHLFERFFRGGNATHIQGTGLGLNIVARYAELMNGNVTIESAQNKGTTVRLFIPR